MVICLEQGADLHTAQLMPLPLTVSCFSKIQIGVTFLVPAHPGSPGKRAVKRVCMFQGTAGLIGSASNWWLTKLWKTTLYLNSKPLFYMLHRQPSKGLEPVIPNHSKLATARQSENAPVWRARKHACMYRQTDNPKTVPPGPFIGGAQA